MSLEVDLAILIRIYPEGGRTSVVIYRPTTAGMYLLSTQDRIGIVSVVVDRPHKFWTSSRLWNRCRYYQGTEGYCYSKNKH